MVQAINARFATTPHLPVTFRVDIGNGQVASSLITLPGRQPIRRRDSFELDLGLGEHLKGKQLLCTTIATDVREETNRTSVRVLVTDGSSTVDESRDEDAEEHGIVTYATVVRFR